MQYVTNFQALWGDDVGLFAFRVLQKGDKCGTVRIVLDGLYCARDTVVVTTEINDTVTALMTATTLANSHLTGAVTASAPLNGSEQAFLRLVSRQLVEFISDVEAGTGRYRLKLSDWHYCTIFSLNIGAKASVY